METFPETAQPIVPRKRWRGLMILGASAAIVALAFGAYRYLRDQHSDESLSRSYLAAEIPPTDLVPLAAEVDVAELWAAAPEDVLASYTALSPAQLRQPVHQLGMALAHLQLGQSAKARSILVSLDLQLSPQRNQARWLVALSYLQEKEATACLKLCDLIAKDAQSEPLQQKAQALSDQLRSWWRR